MDAISKIERGGAFGQHHLVFQAGDWPCREILDLILDEMGLFYFRTRMPSSDNVPYFISEFVRIEWNGINYLQVSSSIKENADPFKMEIYDKGDIGEL